MVVPSTSSSINYSFFSSTFKLSLTSIIIGLAWKIFWISSTLGGQLDANGSYSSIFLVSLTGFLLSKDPRRLKLSSSSSLSPCESLSKESFCVKLLRIELIRDLS